MGSSHKYVAMALFENWGNKVLKSCNWWPIFGPLKVVQFNWEQIMLQAGCDFDISKFPIHRMREGLLFEALVSFENLECYFHSNPSSPIKNFSFVTFVLQQLFGRAVLIACSWTNIWNLLYKRKRKEKEERERGKRKRKEKKERERGKRKCPKENIFVGVFPY